jgi:hypothetical protein
MNKTNPTTNEETGSQLAGTIKRNTIDRQDTRTRDLHHCTCQPDAIASPQTPETTSTDRTTSAINTPTSPHDWSAEPGVGEPARNRDLAQVVVVPEDIFELDVVAEDEDTFVLFGGPSGSALDEGWEKSCRYAYFRVRDEFVILRSDNRPFTVYVAETKRNGYFIDSVTWVFGRTDDSVTIRQAPMRRYLDPKWPFWPKESSLTEYADDPWPVVVEGAGSVHRP